MIRLLSPFFLLPCSVRPQFSMISLSGLLISVCLLQKKVEQTSHQYCPLMHWLILISEIKERKPPSVYPLCPCQRSVLSFLSPFPALLLLALRTFSLRSFHTYLRSIQRIFVANWSGAFHLLGAVQLCLATSITWYSYRINRRASKKAWLVTFCIQVYSPALQFIFFDLRKI